MANRYHATPAQIRAIKAAIKRHNMKSVTWQSVAARPGTIREFLTRVEAQDNADKHGIPMAFGYQSNDVTGENEFGYCPLAAVGPAFVHTVLDTYQPTN